MRMVNLNIDGRQVQVPAGKTILEAARSADIYVPTLCHHPDLPPAAGPETSRMIFQGSRKIVNKQPGRAGRGCGLCAVEVEGVDAPVDSCVTVVEKSMVVTTGSDRLKALRKEKLVPILARHRHACLTCAQQEGCPRTQCSINVPEDERCCPQFGHCELQRVVNYVGIADSTPRWVPTDLAAIKSHPLFTRDYNLCIGCTRCVRVCRDLRGIAALGFVYDESGQIQIGTLAETLEDSGCKFCTACVEVCPTGSLADKAVSEATREEALVPCRTACPVQIDVPGYLRLIAMGKADEANAVIREKVPFPGVLGRVCAHPCEEACRRGEINQPVSICALKRYAADNEKGLWRIENKVTADSGKKAAVVGAGPAGLTAAFYLRKKGHAVSLYESCDRAGGMMRYGIPEFRLPRDLLDSEINDIMTMGIDFLPNQILGCNFSVEDLIDNGFDAVFLSMGAGLSRPISLQGGFPGEILWGIDFLRRVAEGEKIRLKRRVVVIGGGNVAVDAARTALRCGAEDVKIACLETMEAMPADLRQIEGARAEGVQILFSRGPDKIIHAHGRVVGLDLKECTCILDSQGHFCPQFSDQTDCLPADQIILAVGQTADLYFLDDDSPILSDGRVIIVDEDTLETGMEHVYAGGDIAGAPGTVVHAVAAGRRAAQAIDRALGGDGNIDEVLFARGGPDPRLGREEGFARQPRVEMPEPDAAARIQCFDAVAFGFSHDQAAREARRCLQCDLRLQIRKNQAPPQAWLPFDEAHIQEVPETEGVFQLLDADRNVMIIKGTADLRQGLEHALDQNAAIAWFFFEEVKMYSMRENELIRKHLQEHGRMPGGSANDLDELY